MGYECYLAMTAAEFLCCRALPPKPAWMACHFSPYTTGLSNFPTSFPPGALLMVNDSTPIGGHDPQQIANQLSQAAETYSPKAIVLDFQRPDQPETAGVVAAILHNPHCPVVVSAQYAAPLDCPVFLPPPPLNKSLETYLAPWKGRQLWMEIAVDTQQFTLTSDGCSAAPTEHDDLLYPHREENCFCRYRTQILPDRICFTLHRGIDQLKEMMEKANKLGVEGFVGLYQQLGDAFAEQSL